MNSTIDEIKELTQEEQAKAWNQHVASHSNEVEDGVDLPCTPDYYDFINEDDEILSKVKL